MVLLKAGNACYTFQKEHKYMTSSPPNFNITLFTKILKSFQSGRSLGHCRRIKFFLNCQSEDIYYERGSVAV